MSTFQIDSGNVKDPIVFEWQPPEELGIDGAGKPLYSAYRTATATFLSATAAQFSGWVAADNAAVHTIYCPNPTGSAFATYSNVIIRRTGGSYGPSGFINGASFLVQRLVV